MTAQEDIRCLVGKTLTSITGLKKGSEKIIFEVQEHEKYTMTHYQDCSEDVAVNDIYGDVADLLHSPIIKAEERTNKGGNTSWEYGGDTFTWTFYHLATIKGHVDIRWYGESNGYYSEEVEFHRI